MSALPYTTEPVPAVTLKPRQVEAYRAIGHALKAGVTRQLVALPTGVGKTVLACEVAARFDRVLFLVPRQELLEQTIRTMHRMHPDRSIGVLWGTKHELRRQFVVGMMQTVYARLDRLPADHFDLVIVDECHHATARTHRTVLDHFTPRLRLGLSATPERADGAPLSNLFDDITYQMTIADAVREGYLVKPLGLQVLTDVDLTGVGTTAGDFNQGQLDQRIDIEERNHLVAQSYLDHAQGRRAIAFCVTIEHGRQLAEAMQTLGIRAGHVWGNDPDREQKIADLRGGRLDVLCNAMVLTEGFDDPAVDCILMARPTKSKPLYTQAVGRGLRLHPGKADCLIVDFVDNCSKHSLANVFDFYRGKPARATEGPGAVVDLTAAPTAADEKADLVQRAADAVQALFNIPADYNAVVREIDLLKPPPEVQSWEYGERRWHYDAATPAQLAVLERLGYDVTETDWTKGQASQLLDTAPASVKQLKLLLAQGYDVLTREWSRTEASAALDQCAKQTPDWGRLGRLKGGRR